VTLIDELTQDLRALGFDGDVPNDWAGLQDESLFPIYEENIGTLEAFFACSTQWRIDGTSGRVLGLDYAGVEACFRMRRVRNRSRMFEDVQAMEREALTVMNRKRS